MPELLYIEIDVLCFVLFLGCIMQIDNVLRWIFWYKMDGEVIIIDLRDTNNDNLFLQVVACSIVENSFEKKRNMTTQGFSFMDVCYCKKKKKKKMT